MSFFIFKKSIILFLLSALFLTCIAKSDPPFDYTYEFEKTAIVKIEFSLSDSQRVNISSWNILPWEKVNKEILLIEKGEVEVELSVQRAQLVSIRIAEQAIQTFSYPSDTLHIYIDNMGSQVKVQLDEFHSKFVRFFQASDQFYEDSKLNKDAVISNAANLTSLKNNLDSITSIENHFIEEYASKNPLPPWFVQFQKANVKYETEYRKLSAIWQRRGMMQIEEEIPSNYFNPETHLLNDTLSLIHYGYVRFLIEYILRSFYTEERLSNPASITKKQLREHILSNADTLLPNGVKEVIMTNVIANAIKSGSNVFEDIEEYGSRFAGQRYYEYLIHIHEEITSLNPGNIAPDFYLYDEKEVLYSLEKLKGKLVYLSFWASWCKPCLQEFSYEHDLLEKFSDKPFVIVSICIDGTKERWLDASHKYDLKTVNLFAEGNWNNKLKHNYTIRGLPHYVLIDQNGKIVGNNVERPSRGIDKTIKKILSE